MSSEQYSLSSSRLAPVVLQSPIYRLSKLGKAWSLANAVLKSLALAKQQTQHDLQQSYLMRAAMETEKLRALIEEIAKDVKK
jgi:hypothetical protein